MKKLAVALLTLTVLAIMVGSAWADTEPGDHLLRSGGNHLNKLAPGQYRPAAVVDTVWYGFVTGGTPRSTGYYYPAGGHTAPAVWDFDRKPDGSQATAGSVESWQGWTGHLTRYRSTIGTDLPSNTPEVYLNYGNFPYSNSEYTLTAPYWHQEDMGTVAVRSGVGANINLEGTGSLWCGMTEATANLVLHQLRTTPACAINFPGYGDLWDQYISHDIAISSGGTTLSFKYAVDTDIRPGPEGDPDAAYQNGSAYDALSVWAGIPTVALPLGAAIPNTSDIDDLLRTTGRNNLSPLAIPSCAGSLDCNGWAGRTDSSGTVFTTAVFGSGTLGIGSQARIVFRVRTNGGQSDEYPAVNYGGGTYPKGSKFGAAVIDSVTFSNAAGVGDGKTLYRFNTAGDLEGWQPSGKPVPRWSKIISVGNNDPNVGGLGFDVGNPEVKWADACGVPGSSTSLCNMRNNVLAQFDQNGTEPITHPRDHYSNNWPNVNGENQQATYSPPIHVAGTPGFGRSGCVIQTDIYLYLPVDDAVFFWFFVRYKPGLNGSTPCPGWSSWFRDPTIYYNDQPNCGTNAIEQSQLMPTNVVTDMEALVGVPTFCWAYGGGTGTCHSNFSPLWDNVQIGFWNAPEAPGIVLFDWDFWQDSYPVDNTPMAYTDYLSMQKRRNATGSIRTNDPTSADFYVKNISVNNAAIDSKTAVMCANVTGQTRPYTDDGRGLAQSDSVPVQSAFAARTSRMDCVFRVLPGPLTSTTGPWFAAFIADNGIFGTPGGHGGSWKWNVWNSVQMDTAEYDGWDSTVNAASAILTTGYYSTTVHEGTTASDQAHYAALGVNHCLPLIDPASSTRDWLTECSGVYSKEHTSIFPSYVFTPGTVIEYFYRSCYLDNTANPALSPDTGYVYSTGARYFTIRILPNAWSDPAYGTPPWSGYGWKGGDGTGAIAGSKNEVVHKIGRPCVLFVDHSFGLSQCYFAYHNTFDTLGIAPFVDDYTSQAPSSGETGIGSYECRLANSTFTFVGSSGPSVKQLLGYGQIYYNSGVLGSSSLADGQNDGDANADVQLLQSWLQSAGGHRGLWLNGTSIALNLSVNRPVGSPSRSFASDILGIVDAGVDNGNPLFNYRTISGDASDCPTVVAGHTPWTPLQETAVTGNLCLYNYDVIPARTDITTSFSSQLYAVGSLSAGVINSVAAAPSGTSKTLIDALDFPRVRNVSCHDSYGRIYQMRTVYRSYFTDTFGGFCPAAVSPVDAPTSARFPNALFQNAPNPFRPNRSTVIRYSIAKQSPVTLNILDVSGRVVRSLVNGSKDAGDYTAMFDGRDGNGAPLASGVYFYRLKVGDFESNKKMLMLK